MGRPTFYYNEDNKTYEIRAGGVLFYKKNQNMTGEFETYLLMIRNRGKLEDFGGCTDDVDKDIYDTISREVEEESNLIFKRSDIKSRIEKCVPVIIEKSKYMLFFVSLTESEEKLTEAQFGTREIHDNIERTVEWINAEKLQDDNFFNNELNYRLKIKTLRNLYDGTNI
jgi:hypothetical protein